MSWLAVCGDIMTVKGGSSRCPWNIVGRWSLDAIVHIYGHWCPSLPPLVYSSPFPGVNGRHRHPISPKKPKEHIGQASSAPYRIPHPVATDNEENTGLQRKTCFLLVKPDFLIIFAWLFPLPFAAPHASRRPLSPSLTFGALSREQQWQASE